MVLTLRLLGRFELMSESGDLPVPGARAQLLLARLALAEGKWLDRAVLGGQLWSDRAEPQARASLRQTIFTLRQGLKSCPDLLQSEGEMLRLDPAAIHCDVTAFDRLAGSSGQDEMEAALTLYRGDLLEGADLIQHDPDGFLQSHRQQRRDQALRVAETLAALHARAGAWGDAVRVARRGLVLDPFGEAQNGVLVQALQALGRYREAQGQDEAFRRMMASELGLALPPRPRDPPSPRPSLGAVPSPALPPPPPIRRDLRRMTLVAAALAVGAGLAVWLFAGPRLTAAPALPDATVSALPTASLQAYDLYLRAEDQRRAASDDADLRAAMAVFQRATALDAGFAEAHAGIALAAVTIAQSRFDAMEPADAARDQAYDAAGLALQRDPENAHALIVLSRLQAMDGAREMALLSAKRAVLSRPDDAEARANLALLLSRNGQASQARGELSRLRQLSPMPRPEGILVYGEIAFAEGRYNDAIGDFVAAWPDLPHSQVLLTHLIASLAIQGQLKQAQVVQNGLLAALPEANLYQLYRHYAPLREAGQNQRLIDGLRRSGLAVWPQGATPAPADRLAGAELASLVGQVPGSPSQYLRGDELCRIEDGRSVCGAIYHAPAGYDVDYVFLAPTQIRFFSLAAK